MKYLSKPHRFFRHLPTLPFIYLAVFPLMLLDFWVELYHRISFPFYGIPLVKRSQYIKIDRHKLSYLSLSQKMNCLYCGYANGLAKYWVAVFAETERYWCGIQHAKDDQFTEPGHHAEFVPYNDEEAFRKAYLVTRKRKF